jgi:hypothetical protein
MRALSGKISSIIEESPSQTPHLALSQSKPSNQKSSDCLCFDRFRSIHTLSRNLSTGIYNPKKPFSTVSPSELRQLSPSARCSETPQAIWIGITSLERNRLNYFSPSIWIQAAETILHVLVRYAADGHSPYGAKPIAGLLVGTNGNLYGATSKGVRGLRDLEL